MAHGKETPRQKMIGMMYLVLTAMLALNVTTSVLDAFALIDNGLSGTTKNYKIKNEKLYIQFENAFTLNKVKVGPWKNKADEIRKEAQELINFVQGLKKEVVTLGEGGSETPALKGDEVLCDFIENKGDLDKAATILIGIEGNGKAFDLKKKIIHFREFLINLIDSQKAPQLVESINGILNTDNPPQKEDGESNTWESSRFEHIPLIAVIPQLTKVQVDVLNCEAEVVNYLLQQVGANDFKFNVLKATVIPSSTYVIKGNDFKAQVFLAASDTTQQPEVLICNYDSTYNKETGEYDYKVAGGSTSIPVSKSGKGLYTAKGTKLGKNFWSGLIQMTAPDGSITRKPFRHTYEVAEPSVVVSPSKMNVFYYGVDNPCEISIPGISMDKITPTINRGTIKSTGTGFIVQPDAGTTTCDITVYAIVDGAKRNMGTKPFRIKQVPAPLPRVGGITGKTVAKNELAAALGVVAEMPKDFDFDMKFRVTEFTLAATIRGFNQDESSKGQSFTEGQKRILNSLQSGSVVNIINIKAVGPKGDVRELNDLVIKIK
ncbi:MAG: gliding motility protein GldM [Bacteroidales bacterium]|nr:MAG: gliding motility protein GldM [Bacteroidales bacterium]